MFLNIRLFILLLLVNLSLVHGQEVVGDQVPGVEKTADPETVFFNIEIFRPVAIGNYSWSKAYHTGGGIALDFNWFALPEFTVGTHASISGGSVKDPSRIGNIQRTTIYLLGLDMGYYHAFDQAWNIHASAGVGGLRDRHTAAEDKFTEAGYAYWVQVQVGYRINRTIGCYFKLQPRYDKLGITAPPSIERYINNRIMINTGIGFRINLQNPGG